MSRLSSMILLTALMVGCGARKAYKSGLEAEGRGQFWRASQYYLDSLDRRDGYDDPHEALDRIGQRALEDGLSQARAEEDGEDFLAAMSWYQGLKTYVSRLEGRGHLNFDPGIDFDDKIAEMRAAAAYEAYARGDDAVRARHWAEAIEHFAEALEISPGFKDTDVRIAESHYGWAEDDVSAGRFRSGAERFQMAHSSQGVFEDAAVRSIELYAALGRHHLASGTCRQAVRDLSIAHREAPEAVRTELARAQDCAETIVFVEPVRGGGRVAGMRPADWLNSYIRRTLPGQTTEFVSIAAEQATKDNTVDFVVETQVVEAWVHEPELQSVQRSTSATKARACNDGEYSPCTDTTTVRYAEFSSSMEARVASSVSIVERAGNRFAGQAEPSATATSDLRWADNFIDADGNAVAIATSASGGTLGVSSDVVSLRDANRTHPAQADLLRNALENTGADLVRSIVRVVDAEPPLQDPTALTVVPLNEK